MTDWASRAERRNRWRYTRAFAEEVAQLAGACFLVVTVIWVSFVVLWAATCGVTLGAGPFCG
jgi:hypothetical protein